MFSTKLSGVNEPTWLAKNTPAKPDVEAPMANASSLTLVVLIPVACAATSSSRTAAQERPSREFSSRRNNSTMTTRKTSSRYQYCSWSSPHLMCSGPMWIAAPLGRGTTRDQERVPIPQLRSELDACETRLQDAIAELHRILDGDRVATVRLGWLLSGGIETEEQLDAALAGIEKEVSRLIGTGKKVIVHKWDCTPIG